MNLKLNEIEPNKGQIPGLPKNPRIIKNDKYRKLVKSIEENPEMLEYRELLVYPYNGKYIIIGGNMRYKAMKELGYTEAPVKVIDQNATVEQLKAYTIKDNAAFGEWDDIAIKEWDLTELDNWGIDIKDEWLQNLEIIDDGDDIVDESEIQPDVKELLDNAMTQYAKEFEERIRFCLKNDFLPWSKTPGYSKLQFLKAKYLGKKYERNNSLVFMPQQFDTSGYKHSYLEHCRRVGNGENKPTGLCTLSNYGDLKCLFVNSYPMCGGRMPLDFPVDTARELIDEFAHKGRVLDPCHGWGGRLVGALLEEVEEYVGFDPSPVAHEGVTKIYENYKEYQDTKVTLYKQPYEESDIKGGFDFALTSPPYFDVEQYDGEEQAHVKYNNYDKWVEKFYRPLIELTMNRLKTNSYFALQVGSQKYPLREDAIRIAKELGYETTIYKEHAVDANNGLHSTEDTKSEAIILIKKTNDNRKKKTTNA